MKKNFPFEFIYQVFSLLLIMIIVHAAYIAVIRPNAEAELEYQAEQLKLIKDFVPKRSIYILIRDYEQEACFICLSHLPGNWHGWFLGEGTPVKEYSYPTPLEKKNLQRCGWCLLYKNDHYKWSSFF